MWPHPGTAPGQWNSSEVIVTTPSKNYTAGDFGVMLEDMGCGKGPKNLYDLEKEDLLQTFPPPLVDTYVFAPRVCACMCVHVRVVCVCVLIGEKK